MINSKKIICIIPARGGSKGLPGKNIKSLCGKPLINWSIDTAKESKYIDYIYISTDSSEIASVAQKNGVDVPELRPKELATDNSTSYDVFLYTLDYLKKQNLIFDILVVLEPTSPLRTSSDVDSAIEMLVNSNGAESIVGICKAEDTNPVFLAEKNGDFIESYLKNDFKFYRRQDVPDVYFFEGSVYASYVNAFMSNKTFYHKKTLGYEFPKWKSLEIDDIYDFIMIEALMKAHKNKIFSE